MRSRPSAVTGPWESFWIRRIEASFFSVMRGRFTRDMEYLQREGARCQVLGVRGGARDRRFGIEPLGGVCRFSPVPSALHLLSSIVPRHLARAPNT